MRSDIIVYTDGLACPNPERIGSGVFIQSGDVRNTYEDAIGVGSNITAELFAIRSAMEKLEVMDKRDFSRVFIFSDCQYAVDLSLDRAPVTHSFKLVRTYNVT